MSTRFGIIGSGTIGKAILSRIAQGGYEVVVFVRSEGRQKALKSQFSQYSNVKFIQTYEKFFGEIRQGADSCTIIIVVPYKDVDDVIFKVKRFLTEKDIVFDFGNSNFNVTQHRAQYLKSKVVDVGISGGVYIEKDGACLMVGMGHKMSEKIVGWEALKNVLVSGQGVVYVGDHLGSGHFVKSLHNLIEYGYMQILSEIVAWLFSISVCTEDIIYLLQKLQDQYKMKIIEILCSVLSEIKDVDMSGKSLWDIADICKYNYTANWMVGYAIEYGIPCMSLADSVMFRIVSSDIYRDKLHHDSNTELLRDSRLSLHEIQEILEDIWDAITYGVLLQAKWIYSHAKEQFMFEASWEDVCNAWQHGSIISGVYMRPDMDVNIVTVKKSLKFLLRSSMVHGLGLPGIYSLYVFLDLIHRKSKTNKIAQLIQAQRYKFGNHPIV